MNWNRVCFEAATPINSFFILILLCGTIKTQLCCLLTFARGFWRALRSKKLLASFPFYILEFSRTTYDIFSICTTCIYVISWTCIWLDSLDMKVPFIIQPASHSELICKFCNVNGGWISQNSCDCCGNQNRPPPSWGPHHESVVNDIANSAIWTHTCNSWLYHNLSLYFSVPIWADPQSVEASNYNKLMSPIAIA